MTISAKSVHLFRYCINKCHKNVMTTRYIILCIILGTAATCQNPSYAHFDVPVALVQYTSWTLFVDFDVLTRKTTE